MFFLWRVFFSVEEVKQLLFCFCGLLSFSIALRQSIFSKGTSYVCMCLGWRSLAYFIGGAAVLQLIVSGVLFVFSLSNHDDIINWVTKI